MLLTLRGTPFIYYGEEIGMRDAAIAAGSKRDPVGRDGCRSPMQWSDARSGGFSTSARTWLPCGDFEAVNVARQLNDSHSMFALYRRLIELRKSTPALVEGSYREFHNAPEDCLMFHRDTATQHIVVALNFTAEPREIDLNGGKILLSTIPDRKSVAQSPLMLAPNEAVIMMLDA
jgi:alpha-glucosidase